MKYFFFIPVKEDPEILRAKSIARKARIAEKKAIVTTHNVAITDPAQKRNFSLFVHSSIVPESIHFFLIFHQQWRNHSKKENCPIAEEMTNQMTEKNVMFN